MPEPSLEAPADPLPAPAASGDGAEAEPDEGSEPAEVTESIPAPEDFVRVADWIPDIYTDLRYATDNNFTGQAIYDFSDAYLRYGTVQKLAAVQETVAAGQLLQFELDETPVRRSIYMARRRKSSMSSPARTFAELVRKQAKASV